MRRKQRLPERWCEQAFKFALDPTDDQRQTMLRHIGMRRKAYNWTVEQIKAGIDAFHKTDKTDKPEQPDKPGQSEQSEQSDKTERSGQSDESGQSGKPSLRSLRKRWNSVKGSLCVDDDGREWWRDLSKEAAANGIDDAVRAYWDWVASRAGRREGPRLRFPKFKKKGRGAESYRITTGSFGLVDRRHVQLPRVGVVRLHENARRLERLVAKGRVRVKSATVSVRSGRLSVSLQVEVLRPQAGHRPARPGSRVGVDLGTRWLAVVASDDGTILERVPPPAPLKAALRTLRRLQRQYARSRRGSNRRAGLRQQISAAHARVADMRCDAMHKLTTRLAKTHGTIVIEDLCVAGLMRQTGPGARARKRALADAALGEFRRQLTYKCGWYGSRLVVADRWYPSSQTCHRCGHRQEIGRCERWTCGRCDTTHHRDDNAAINLARYEPDPVLRERRVREGAQQSCRCGACPTSGRAERLRDSETDTVPTPTTGGGAAPSGTAVPVMRRVGLPQAVNPARGAKAVA